MTDVASQGPAASEGDRAVLTNRQGHPVYDNQNQRTVGARGPATLENYQFLEKISHFDRERIPERVVHARGVTAFGVFEADGTVGDEPIAKTERNRAKNSRERRMSLIVLLEWKSPASRARNKARDNRRAGRTGCRAAGTG